MLNKIVQQEKLFDSIAHDLREKGFVVLDEAVLSEVLPMGLLNSLSEKFRRDYQLEMGIDKAEHRDSSGDSTVSFESVDSTGLPLTPAGVGRSNDFRVNQTIRGDFIHWLNTETPPASTYLLWMEELRLALNQRLFMGLFDYECHYAVYPAGTYYKKHLDAFRGQPSRKLSTILYLNRNWSSEDGGELVLYNEADTAMILKVAPEYGKLVLFLSEDFPHEVLPTNRMRQSIAGWFRINSSD